MKRLMFALAKTKTSTTVFFATLLAIFSITSTASAKSMHPQVFWMPMPGQFALELEYNYNTLDVDDLIGSQTSTDSGIGQGTEFRFDYGLFYWLSLGYSVDYRHVDKENRLDGALTQSSEVGIGDHRFDLLMMIPLVKSRIYLGGEYHLSQNNTQRGSGPQYFNRNVGGNAIKGILGMQMPMGPLWIGIRGEYTMFDPRTLEVDGVATTTLTDGEALDVLATLEMHGSGTIFGIGAGIFQKQKETSTNISTSVATVTQAIDSIHFRLYYNMEITKWMTVLLEGNYFTGEDVELNSSDTRVKEVNTDASIGFRFTF